MLEYFFNVIFPYSTVSSTIANLFNLNVDIKAKIFQYTHLVQCKYLVDSLGARTCLTIGTKFILSEIFDKNYIGLFGCTKDWWGFSWDTKNQKYALEDSLNIWTAHFYLEGRAFPLWGQPHSTLVWSSRHTTWIPAWNKAVVYLENNYAFY